MGLLILLFIGLIVGSVVFGGFMLLAYLLGFYTPTGPSYRGSYTPAPKPAPDTEPTVEMSPDELERYKNLRYAMIEAETREFVRHWEKRRDAGQITPTEFEDMVNRLLDEGLLKSTDYSYRSDRKF